MGYTNDIQRRLSEHKR
ncbi:TPA: hypothetical protein DCZ39_04870 [Patescibacteria group bacterium]|nr:hypothetical protein [Candidatus Gracilibacteria bacterium]